jgi:hypothetical protein
VTEETTLIAKQQNGRPVARVRKTPGEERYVVEVRKLFGWSAEYVFYKRSVAEKVAEEIANPEPVKVFHRK